MAAKAEKKADAKAEAASKSSVSRLSSRVSELEERVKRICSALGIPHDVE